MSKLILIPFLFLCIVYWLEIKFPHLPGRDDRTVHTGNNLTIAVMGGLVNLVFLFTIIGVVTHWTEVRRFGLLNQVNIPIGLRLFSAIVLFDMWMYVWHMMNHRITLLWRIHRAHHNDITMDSTTALRFHPLEIVLSQFFNIGIIVLLSLRLNELLVYNLVLQMVIFFHHSNVGLTEGWDRVFRAILVMPNMHRVHHSIEVFETNSNYGSIFSFWDRLFSTFRKRNNTNNIIYGLNRFRENGWQGVLGFLKIPFQKSISEKMESKKNREKTAVTNKEVYL
ncbi:MAG: sterol desaturase family protein [Candidatus Omnitrophota bacterium]|nr:MAG: sterol desaturase family protein [Candidatus Omnitrophota bacterium]